MTTAVRIVGRPEVLTGFALASLPTSPVDSVEEAVGVIQQSIADGATGVVLIEDRLEEALPEELRHSLARRSLPIVIPFPGPEWKDAGDRAEAYVVDLLRRAIGYSVRLR